MSGHCESETLQPLHEREQAYREKELFTCGRRWQPATKWFEQRTFIECVCSFLSCIGRALKLNDTLVLARLIIDTGHRLPVLPKLCKTHPFIVRVEAFTVVSE